MEYSHDTISAISTPVGIGGISILRVSGENAIKVVSKIFEGKKDLVNQSSHKAVFGRILDATKLVDEVIVTVFRSPHSYTGEDVVEISCHGSTFITNQILSILLKILDFPTLGAPTRLTFNPSLMINPSSPVLASCSNSLWRVESPCKSL